MSYALIKDAAVVTYPYSFAQLRADNPNVSYPRDPSDEWLAAIGVFKVADAARPAHDPIAENVIEASPALVAGVWTRQWSVVPASAEEIAARQLRAADIAARDATKALAFVQQFIAMTSAEVETYVTNNTANLAQVRTLMVRMAQMLHVLARREFRD